MVTGFFDGGAGGIRTGYWIFRWRSGWDSNPRAREDYLISSQARYDHFDTAPYMLSRRFFPPFSGEKGLWKELTERTANYSVFRTVENPHGYKVFGGRNGQFPARFRVSHLRPLEQLSVYFLNCSFLIQNIFGENYRREQEKIFDFNVLKPR